MARVSVEAATLHKTGDGQVAYSPNRISLQFFRSVLSSGMRLQVGLKFPQMSSTLIIADPGAIKGVPHELRHLFSTKGAMLLHLLHGVGQIPACELLGFVGVKAHPQPQIQHLAQGRKPPGLWIGRTPCRAHGQCDLAVAHNFNQRRVIQHMQPMIGSVAQIV